MEFETLFKVIIAGVAMVGIPVGAYAAVVATRAIWIKGEPKPADTELMSRVESLETRLHQLESDHDRFLELEERVDFAERMLARRPESAGQLSEGRQDRVVGMDPDGL
jgi:hypothetical protein